MLNKMYTPKTRFAASSGHVLKLFGESNTIVKLSLSLASALLADVFYPSDPSPGKVICISYWRGMIEVSRCDDPKIAEAWLFQSFCNHTLCKSLRGNRSCGISSSTVLILLAAQEITAVLDLIL